MNYSNLFKIALRAIAANKLRSFLTALGIIIGVASVITMLAIGQGSKRSIQANIAEMGSNMIMISPGADRGPGGVRQDASSMETLKLTDYASIKDECHFIKGISPTVNSSERIEMYAAAVPAVMPGHCSIAKVENRDIPATCSPMKTNSASTPSAK